jgi:hypothetical protein
MADCLDNGIITAPDGTELSYDGLPDGAFRLIFPKAPFVTMFLQQLDLPGIQVNQAARKTPLVDMNEIGEKLNYLPFTCSFLVDKNLKNYKEIYNWMKRMTVNGTIVGETDTASLVINGKEMCTFVDCWPTSLGQLTFTTTNNDVVYVTCTAVFNYDYLEFSQS